jgi:hydrogenase large subunit
VNHYLEALAVRRKAHQMGAIFGGRLPMAANFVPGGSSEVVTAEKVDAFGALLTEMHAFIDNVYIPDVLAVAGLFSEYGEIGMGCGNLLSYGVFDLDDGTRLLARGRLTQGASGEVEAANIKEYVKHSWYTPDSGDLNPRVGVTEPDVTKEGAYSFVKSPRYEGKVYEVGPLARMAVNGDYPLDGLELSLSGISVLDRVAARAVETKLVADAMLGWLGELVPGGDVYIHSETPRQAEGIGLTEAPRGALGHWTQIADSQIARYQIVTPTGWNASPRDDASQYGAIEQALTGTPVEDTEQPIEILRVVHSFDPCLACAIHMVRPGKGAEGLAIRA